MNSSPKCAIVILNWNGKKFLEQFLPPVILSTYSNYEVVVADNDSTDDSVDFLEKNHPAVRVIRLSQNWGFAKGYNEALKQVEADYFVILNSDVEVTPGWLQPMVELLEKDPAIAACQPKILSYHDKTMFEYAGAAGGWIDKFGYPFCKGRVFEICEEDLGQYDIAEPIFWASGAALFIRSSIFNEMTGFDDFFFAHQEEIDLCWRIQRAGYKVYSCPAATVYHVGAGTLQKTSSKKTFLNFRNNLIMLSKNLTASKKITVLPARFLLDGITAWRGLFNGQGSYFAAILKAQFAFINWCLFHRKQSSSPMKKKVNLLGLYRGSIAWQYFIKRKKSFSEIVRKTS